jgi:uncharacterized membrane protein YhaH (DUF805 family)
MEMFQYWKLVVTERYAKFDGRANRAEFWWFTLFNFIVNTILNVLGQASDLFWVIGVLYSLALLVPSIGVGIRRLHDINRSGWWLLIGLVPCVGFIVLIVFFATEGTRGPNQYGPQPGALAPM